MKLQAAETFGHFTASADPKKPGPYIEYVKGQVFEIDDSALAQGFIDKGHALAVDAPTPEPTPEAPHS